MPSRVNLIIACRRSDISDESLLRRPEFSEVLLGHFEVWRICAALVPWVSNLRRIVCPETNGANLPATSFFKNKVSAARAGDLGQVIPSVFDEVRASALGQ